MMHSNVIVVGLVAVATVAVASVRPGTVRRDVARGQTIPITKTITLDEVGSARVPVDICFVQDATGSFDNARCGVIANSIPDIVEVFASSDARFGFKTFKDYSDGLDEVYENRLSGATGDELQTAYEELCLEPPSGGGDNREAQYDAITRAVGPGPGDCGWRKGSNRIMVAVHDDGCKGPGFGPEYMATQASVRALLVKESVLFIGVTTGGLSTRCFQPFATDTGGAIVEFDEFDSLLTTLGTGLEDAAFSVTPEFSPQCSLLDISFDPPFPWLLQEGESITVTETVTTLATPPLFINCNVVFPLVGLQKLRLNLLVASCGNGVVEDDEQCDEDSQACDSDCTCSETFRFNRKRRMCVPLCGNRRVDPRVGEECDGSPYCLDTCKCDVNFTSRRNRCRCFGGNIVGGKCILS